MKKLATSLLFLSAFVFSNAQTSNLTLAVADVLQLKETSHDFGKIPQSKPVYHNFEIVNTGKQPLVLSTVTASCGCTTPEWSHEPIAPGTTSIIKVGYNAAGDGYFEKTITIAYNGDKTKQLIIKGTVWKAPEGSAPANASITFLKQTNQ